MSRHRRSSEAGFSLLWVMVSTAILAIVSLGLLAMQNQISAGISMNMDDAAVDNTMKGILTAFGDDDAYCKHVLGGLAFNPADPNGAQIAQIAVHDITGTSIETVASLANPKLKSRPVVRIEDMRLRPVTTIEGNTHLTDLEIQFHKSGAIGSGKTVRRLPVLVRLNAGRIEYCSTQPFASLIINERICAIELLGFGMYDPVEEKCVDSPVVEWVRSSDPRLAPCGAGKRLAKPENMVVAADLLCRNGAARTDFPPRTYTDGTVLDDPIPVAIPYIDEAAQACRFRFFASVTTPSTESAVKCVPR